MATEGVLGLPGEYDVAAHTAAEAGDADRSHLCHDAVEFADMTPTHASRPING